MRVREGIKQLGLLLYDAFNKFDYDKNGLLSPAEVWGAFDFLGMHSMTAHDVVDFVRTADTDRDGNISYKEFIEILQDPEAAESTVLVVHREIIWMGYRLTVTGVVVVWYAGDGRGRRCRARRRGSGHVHSGCVVFFSCSFVPCKALTSLRKCATTHDSHAAAGVADARRASRPGGAGGGAGSDHS